MRKHSHYKALFNLSQANEKDYRIRLNPAWIPFPLFPSVFIIIERQTNETSGGSVFKALLQFKSIKKEGKWKNLIKGWKLSPY